MRLERVVEWFIHQRMRIQTAKNQSVGQESTIIITLLSAVGFGMIAGFAAYALLTIIFWMLGKWWLDMNFVTLEQKIALKYNDVQRAIYDSANANLGKRNAHKNENRLREV